MNDRFKAPHQLLCLPHHTLHCWTKTWVTNEIDTKTLRGMVKWELLQQQKLYGPTYSKKRQTRISLLQKETFLPYAAPCFTTFHNIPPLATKTTKSAADPFAHLFASSTLRRFTSGCHRNQLRCFKTWAERVFVGFKKREEVRPTANHVWPAYRRKGHWLKLKT